MDVRTSPYLADVTHGAFPRKPAVLRVLHRPGPAFIGISGGEGSYTHIAGRRYARERGIKLPHFEYLTFVEEVLHKLQEGHIDVGIFGIVNSTGGVVEEYMPFLGHFRWNFVEVITFEVNHMLLALPDTGRDEVRSIVSQEQALRQCPEYLATNWPGIEPTPYIDTAMAAKDLAEGTLPLDTAVIASEACVELYGLQILDARIQDKKPNITSFIVAEPFE